MAFSKPKWACFYQDYQCFGPGDSGACMIIMIWIEFQNAWRKVAFHQNKPPNQKIIWVGRQGSVWTLISLWLATPYKADWDLLCSHTALTWKAVCPALAVGSNQMGKSSSTAAVGLWGHDPVTVSLVVLHWTTFGRPEPPQTNSQTCFLSHTLPQLSQLGLLSKLLIGCLFLLLPTNSL